MKIQIPTPLLPYAGKKDVVDVSLNDEDVRYLGKEATAVREGDTLSIVPSIAGGAGPR
jgi:sulfur-carrier protein